MKSRLLIRRLLRNWCLTPNTLRYRVEWRWVEKAARQYGPFDCILDGGCGSGEMLRKMLNGGYAKTCIGVEPEATSFAKLKENIGSDPRVRLFSATLENIPLSDGSIDAIMTTQVLEHIVDHEAVAREFSRLLKPAGTLIVGVPHPPEPFPNEGHVREGYTEEDLLTLFQPVGFEHLWTEYYLIDRTVQRYMRARKLPLSGVFLPSWWADCEAHLSTEERKARQPFGILGVFRKKVST